MSHSLHTLTVKQIISRVRQAFPNAPETYIMSLINDAITEMGSVGNYYTKAKELAYEVVTTIEKCINAYDQRNALYGELDGRLLKSAEDYTEGRDKMAAVEGVQLEGAS